jgi:hypothetical protein
MTTAHSHHKILEMLQTSTNPPIIATDGSVRPYKARGTFAWVLADHEGTPWLWCRGPVSVTPIDSEFVGRSFSDSYFYYQDLYIYR